MVCTYEGSLHYPNAISWTDGRCAGGPATSAVPLVMRLDFPACYVSVQGKGLPADQVLQAGIVTIAGFDAHGLMKDSFSSRDIYNSAAPDSTGTFHYSAEGTGLTSIPKGSINPTPSFPQQGFDVRRVTITEQNLAALDNITITACLEAREVEAREDAEEDALSEGPAERRPAAEAAPRREPAEATERRGLEASREPPGRRWGREDRRRWEGWRVARQALARWVVGGAGAAA